MDDFFIWVEGSALGFWVRGETGALMAFPIIISLHAIGMGFLAGIAGMINLRILGVVPRVPLDRFNAFLPVAWFALGLNVISGVLLLVGYPTKALTNPVFYVKLVCVGLAVWGLFYLRRSVLRVPQPEAASRAGYTRSIAMLATLFWIAAIVTGRLLAYTHTRLLSIYP